MAAESLYKDDPGLPDGHVDGPAWGPYRNRSPQRSAYDITDEAEADDRSDAYPFGWSVKSDEGFATYFKASGVNEELGLVFGWGIVCKDWDEALKQAQPYWDVQRNHIPENSMVKATTKFMRGARMAGHQHARMEAGTILHSFPLTAEIWKAMFSTPDGRMLGNLPAEPPKSGWMVACAPDPAMLAKFKSGELTGFSIGGKHVRLDGKAI